MDKETKRVLELCLDRLRRGQSWETCLAQYPEYAGELEPLLRAIWQVQQATNLEARSAFKAEAHRRFMARLQLQPRIQPRRLWLLSSRWAVALGSLLLVLLGGGTVVVADSNLPDEPLYPVKIAVEQVRVVLTPVEIGKAELEARFAERRGWEMGELARRNRPQAIEKAQALQDWQLEKISRMASNLENGKAKKRERLEAILESHANLQRVSLEKFLEDAPLPSRPALRRALAQSDASYKKALREMRQQRKFKPQESLPSPPESSPSNDMANSAP